MFSLDILKAKYGDCLLLQSGTVEPVRILVDAGLSKNFKNILKPHMQSLCESVAGDKKPLINLLLLSYIDADHIGGVNALLHHEKAARYGDEKSLLCFGSLWHNSFLSILSDATHQSHHSATSAIEPVSRPQQLAAQLQLDDDSKAVIASIEQSIDLSTLSRYHRMKLNESEQGALIVEGESIDDYAPFKLQVLGPSVAELDKLREHWIEYLQQHPWRSGTTNSAAAEILDSSIASMSSIVVMVECEGQRVLLVGNARGDYVVEALQRNGYMEEGVCEVDVFKWPQHANLNSLPRGIFRSIVADHHVISLVGCHDDVASIARFVDEHSPEQATTLHTSYRSEQLDRDALLHSIFEQALASGHKIGVDKHADNSPWITLGLPD